jgi:hypothetical protein
MGITLLAADYTERRWPGRPPDDSDYGPSWREWCERRDAMIREATEALQERGARFFRLTLKSAVGELVVEGWRQQPAEQGEPPL